MRILVTGAGGYIGTVLVPKLLAEGHTVTGLDLFYYGADRLPPATGLYRIMGDIRDEGRVADLLRDGRFDAVVHLAAISNDPSSELDPDLTRSVNLVASRHLMEASHAHGVGRFLFASSASVYGIKDTPNVTEEHSLDPITLYARYKAECEGILNGLVDESFCGVSVRSATVCGLSPRLRLDLTINILTHFALTRGAIRVFGGDQMRPNIHVEDIADFYVHALSLDADVVRGRAFNISRENSSVMGLAEMVRAEIGPDVKIGIVETDDHRSYSLSADLARRELGFSPRRELQYACTQLRDAYATGRVPDPESDVYRNVELMKTRPFGPVEWTEL
ncbi:MAG: NAD-dependent epimerase/dehydratase [Gemmatimonadota bacterium]|nr:NAD-dependent epimerase/dehydratase [Gemmatimonadota bacterium]